MASREQKSVGWLEICTALFFCLAILTVVWVIFRQPVGLLYRAARTAETGTLWKLTAWGEYFTYTPGKELSIQSIFLSSLPFGVLSGGIIFLVGLLMRAKVEGKHIITYLRPKKDAEYAMSHKELMQRFAPFYPHCEFFLKFPMHRYSASSGPASQPMSALELLIDSGAIVADKFKTPDDEEAKASLKPGEADEEQKAGERAINRTALRRALEKPFGSLNPFLNVNLRNDAAVRTAIDELPWYASVILYAALVRVNALHDSNTKLSNVLEASEEFLRDVWRDINREKTKLGDSLVIGPYDYPDTEKKGGKPKKTWKKTKASGAVASNLQPANMVILADHLAKVGPNFKMTKRAKDELAKIIVKPSAGIDPKRPVDVIDRIVQRHGFVFGVLASSLTDGKDGTIKAARSAGVMAPNTFLWLRFADRGMWRFLNYVGMQTPCPEAAGMYDHWQTELVLKTGRTRPEIAESTITAIVQEARKQSPDALTMRDFDELVAKVRNQTNAVDEMIIKSSEIWNDDRAPAPHLVPER
jgi:hypothetical protein